MSINLFNLKYIWLIVVALAVVIVCRSAFFDSNKKKRLSYDIGVKGTRVALLFFPILALAVVVCPLVLSLLWLMFWFDYSGTVAIQGISALIIVFLMFSFLYFKLDEDT